MPAVYDQFLAQVASQLVTLGTTGFLTHAPDVRVMDWDDVVNLGGLTVRYDNDIRENQEATNERDIYGYPAHLIFAVGWHLQAVGENATIQTMKQTIRRYYHNKRRMSAIVESNVSQEPTTVINGPRPPYRLRDRILATITVMGWFLEPRTP